MKLEMLTGMGGPKVNLVKGDPYECKSDEEAVRLVRSGFATTTNDKDAKAVADAIAKLDESEKTAAETDAAEARKADAKKAGGSK